MPFIEYVIQTIKLEVQNVSKAFHKIIYIHRNRVEGYQPLSPTPFVKFSHFTTLPANQLNQVSLINRNTTVKYSPINTIHIKQQHNLVFFFILK